jgi:hypothetical protein
MYMKGVLVVGNRWYPVRVTISNHPIFGSDVFEDEIQGTSPENAVENARWNWAPEYPGEQVQIELC